MKSVPSRPRIILRTIQTDRRNVLLDDHDGEEAILVMISRDCLPFDFYCDVELKDGRVHGLSSEFFEFVDKKEVPRSHARHGPVAIHAWLTCHYRDEAYAEEIARRNALIERSDAAYVAQMFPSTQRTMT